MLRINNKLSSQITGKLLSSKNKGSYSDVLQFLTQRFMEFAAMESFNPILSAFLSQVFPHNFPRSPRTSPNFILCTLVK